MKKVLTLSIVHQHPKVLLGMKKRGFGQGRWNGFGGKLKVGENIIEAAKREIYEEIGIMADALELAGIIDFEFKDNPEILEVHIFRISEFKGEPAESEEMRPQWFPIDEIPFGEMWPDDVYWMPLFLQGKKFRGRVFFDGMDKILEHNISAVENLEEVV